MAHITLILGGARSGKSGQACALALASGRPVTFVATATASDAEMEERIARHQRDRPAHWQLVEAPLALADTLTQHGQADRCLLVDCLTLWLNNQLHLRPDADLATETQALLQALREASGQIILVANEVGLGIIPMGELSRRFVDEAGRLNQLLARAADCVLLVTAGLPLLLKGELPTDVPA